MPLIHKYFFLHCTVISVLIKEFCTFFKSINFLFLVYMLIPTFYLLLYIKKAKFTSEYCSLYISKNRFLQFIFQYENKFKYHYC